MLILSTDVIYLLKRDKKLRGVERDMKLRGVEEFTIRISTVVNNMVRVVRLVFILTMRFLAIFNDFDSATSSSFVVNF